MKRDIKLLNKSLAFAITAAMTITSVSPSVVMAENEFAAAEEFGDGFTVADTAETPTAEDAPVEVTEEAAGFGDEAAAEEAFVDEATTDEAVIADAEAVSVGTPGTPGKVTGLWIDTESEYVWEPTLRWNYVAGVSRYEFSVVDAQGNEYSWLDRDYDETAGKWVYKRNYSACYDGDGMPYMTVDSLAGMYAYKITDGDYEVVYADAEKTKELVSMTAGQTYTIRVRAVYTYQASAADKPVDTAGEWSDAVTYTVPADQVPVQITNLRYVSEDEEYLYFDYDGDVKAGQITYQISRDGKFEDPDWESNSVNSRYKLRMYKDSFSSGVTYYLRAANFVKGNTVQDAEHNTVWSNVITFRITKQEEPLKAITGFALYNTTNTAFEFHFDPILESDESWALQYSKDSSFVAGVKEINGGNRVYKKNLEPGATYYVRALTYRYNDKGEKEYGQASQSVTISRAKVPSMSDLTLAEKTQSEFLFKYTGVLNEDCGIEYWVSEDGNFANNPDITEAYRTTDDDRSFSIGFYELTPGKTYYVRARAFSDEYALADDNTAEYRYYGSFTNTVAIRPTVARVSVSGTAESKKITLRMSPENGYVTGYQIQKKSGKKYRSLAKTTEGAYADKSLKADTAYSYRVRAYYIDEKTNKTTYGEWSYYDATTWGGNLNLIATTKSATSVKLVWNKISGAKGYEVYRRVTASNDSAYSAAAGGNGYTKWALVKNITKGSTKSYTMKGLTAGTNYSFKVRAYRTVGSKKFYIEDTDNVSLAFEGGVQLISTTTNKNGTVKAAWKPVYAGNGYLIEKYNNKTDKYETFATIAKASAGSYTFPASVGETAEYRIRAYKNGTPKEYADGAAFVHVSPYLAVPAGVTAKANNADGSITVSWKAVAGADYYKVFRTTAPAVSQNKDTGSYSYYGGTEVPVLVADTSSRAGYKYSDDELTATTLVDRNVKYTTAGGIEKTFAKGPSAGVKYFYYVIAYKYGIGYETQGDRSSYYSGASKAAYASVTKASVAAPKMSSVKASKGKVVISWKKSANAAGYEVFRSTKKSSGYTKIASTKSSVVKYADKKAAKGKKYYYKVRAVSANEAGISIYSGYSGVKAVTAK